MKTLKFKTSDKTVLEHPYIKDVLIYDIETDSLDTQTARCVFFGAYSYKYGKYFIFREDEKEEIQTLLDDHRILVGFNNKSFDGPILQNSRNRFNIIYKIVFDCLNVLYDYKRRRPNREVIIKHNGVTLQEALPNRKLKTVCELLDFPITKGDIDYKIFRQESWTEEEYKEIYRYLYKDVDLTRQLFEFYINYFNPFKEYVDDGNIRKFDYIRSSLGSYAYSAICNLTGVPTEFEDDFSKLQQRPLNEGGFVLEPQIPYAEGTVIYADWASLYPSIYFQCNLFSPTDNPKLLDKWAGGKLFPDLQTTYRCDEMGKTEKVLKQIYLDRLKYKKEGDVRQLPLKILLNTLYGISGSPIFKNVFNMTTSGDCTYIGRTLNQYTGKRFSENGYKVIYGDTDSTFLVLPEDKTIEDFKALANQIADEIKAEFPFPSDTFKLDIDDIYSKIWLFGKKNYCGINKDNKLIVKGLPIKKHNASQLGMKIFETIKPLIIEQQTIKFPRDYFEKIIDEEIDKDITIIGQLYNVKAPSDYKSTTSIQCQIATKFGEGSHILIPNKSLGDVGKTKKYATTEQAKTLSFSDLFLDKVWAELEPFISDKSE
ncbi:hypothetical protein HN865_02275 [Candidatus Woesearchaeota archaeon]|nr:hypothetical protein [Candidatus Woesearchaeota archaeon]